MKNARDLGLNTLAIHAGKREGDIYGAMHDPIYMTSNYRLPTDGTPVDWSGINSSIYARNGSVNQFILQDKLAALEGAEDCAVFGSGVAALAAVFITFLNSGDHVICSKVCYSAVGILMSDILPRKYNIEVSMVDSTCTAEVQAALRPNTKLIHIETPGNPTTGLSDVAAIAAIAKQHNALLSVDSTFASPLYLKPLSLGADLVVHSMTKYINGHGDALGGCILGDKSLINIIKEEAMVNLGGIISPLNAWLIARGITTLPLRMKQHSQTALAVAEFLQGHPAVRFVSYPGLKSHPQHQLAKEQMSGFSGMICFDIHGDMAAHTRFAGSLALISYAVSLGDAETILVYYEEGNEKLKYYPEMFSRGFYRFSIGLEDAADLIADLQQALQF